MSIPYLIRKKRSAIKGERKTLWYAVASKFRKKTEEDIANLINQRGTFHRGVVLGVLKEVSEVLQDMLSDGNTVTINGIGNFQVSLTSKGFEQPEDVLPKEVEVSRIYYIADRKLSRNIKEAEIVRSPLENGNKNRSAD